MIDCRSINQVINHFIMIGLIAEGDIAVEPETSGQAVIALDC